MFAAHQSFNFAFMIKILWLLLLVTSVKAENDKRGTGEYCLKSKYHKKIPSPEDSLFGECSPWKNNSCCNWNTSVQANELNLHNFTYDHCLREGKPEMSQPCRSYFVLDSCFFECSPDLEYWVVRDGYKHRYESFKNVPLCASECDAWFEACKNDFTCTANWAHTFDWSTGTNKCLSGHICKTFEQVYENATQFCEKVWFGSWQYINDGRPCMKLTFDENKPNPNVDVSQWYSVSRCSACQNPASLLLLFIAFCFICCICIHTDNYDSL